MSLIEIKGLCCGYNGREVLNHLDLRLDAGARLGLAGHTGSGKTTLLKTIMGLILPKAGSVHIEGQVCRCERDFAKARSALGYLFQNPDDQLFCPTVIEDVAFGPLNLGVAPPQAREIAQECLGQVGLAGFEERLTHCLSGGEKRLASLAGVLAMRPKALLLDEPTTGLDPESKARVAEVLCGLDLALLIVSHEWDFLTQVTSRYFVLSHGHLHEAAEAPHVHQHIHVLGAIPHEHD